MKRLVFLLLCMASAALGGPLDPLLAKPDLWSLNQDSFERLSESRQFRWTSNARDSARAATHDLNPENILTLYNLPVTESLVRFEGGKLTQFVATIYSRGDAGEIKKEVFEELLRKTIDALDTATKVKYTPRGREAGNAVHAEGLLWQNPTAQYLLEYSFTREMKSRDVPFRAEFVRLTVTPPTRTTSLLASASNAAQARFNGLTHVKRDSNSGDVLIADIPMVDQGQKGYCAVACTERVMRYYGVSVDENELAQVANTATEGGTSPEAMFGALKKLSARLHVRVHAVEQLEIKQILALQTEYNRAAKKESVAQLPDQGHFIDINGMFEAMKPDLLSEVRTKNKAEVSRFERAVEDHINQGVPLLWSVVVGLFPEHGVSMQNSGGHMRLIIGYNNKTQEILYSDSWGRGHELKRMPLNNAVAMTVGMTTLEPL